ncbi:hypothetical protein SADUNF_Sadunf16G0139900 [Salix dunnii]|uniref:Alkyl transferase n=1 Tax=Salix dunnii TaxID=1413687 RepID=A0A835MGY7_9ROSI|nr:hypothetical protein SADUNF_Sadunf16G0139900 [Salix dunnii]
MMQSLNFPPPVYNNYIPTPQKANHFLFRNRRDQTRRFPTLLLAAKHDLALNDEEDIGGGAAPLPEGLRREMMPRHVAVIMDGNARWARQRGVLEASAGHEVGGRSLRELVELCCEWGIRVLTVFAFSYDNWTRPKVEVVFLMSLFERMLRSELDNFMRKGIRVSTIGDSSRLPESLKKMLSDVEEKTRDNSILHLIVAVSYSGKYDVTQACKSIAQKVKDGVVQMEDIDESLLEQELETNCSRYPCPDLLIRTSGELRISNFLLWQLAYTELFFAEALWPDFGKAEFIEALTSYQQRRRRYGGRHS